MSLELINPDDLPIPEVYTQVVVTTGSKLVFVSGQQPEDIHGKLVGHGDFTAQARLAFGNLGRASDGEERDSDKRTMGGGRSTIRPHGFEIGEPRRRKI
jgi:hypothetical protein